MKHKSSKSRVRNSFIGKLFGRLAREEDGFAMEYIIIVLLVAAAVVALVMVFSGNLRNMLGHINDTTTAQTTTEVESVGSDYNTRQEKMKTENDTAKSAGDKLGGDFGSSSGGTSGGGSQSSN